MRNRLQVAEAACAALITVAVVGLHLHQTVSAGALWRDETNTIGIATLPSLGAVWSNLHFDSFPIVWILFVRACAGSLGVMNDQAFRLIGLLVGLSVVAGLWLNAWVFRYRFPLVSVVLLAMSPSVIRWGDSFRAYGLGMVSMLITAATVWRYLESPTIKRYATALIVGVISVHVVYYNAVALLAVCAGGIVVCAMKRNWKTAATLLMIGVTAAVTMIPYVTTVQKAAAWNSIFKVAKYDFWYFAEKLNETLEPGGRTAFLFWLETLIVCFWAAIRSSVGPLRRRATAVQQEMVMFALVLVVVGGAGSFAFLKQLSYLTEPWYYLSFLTIIALGCDIMIGVLCVEKGWRVARIVAVASICTFTFPAAVSAVGYRFSNADVTAAAVSTIESRGDLIIVSPWYHIVSFNRYYRGSVRWTTLPQMSFARFQRVDLSVEWMSRQDSSEATTALLSEVMEVLMQGHKVMLVGNLDLRQERMALLPGSAAKQSDRDRELVYQRKWALTLEQFVASHASTIAQVPVFSDPPASLYEQMRLVVAQGWREIP